MKQMKKEEVGTTEAKNVGCSWAVSVSMSAGEVNMKVEGGAGKAGTGAQTELVKASTEQHSSQSAGTGAGRREKRRGGKEDGYRSRLWNRARAA